MLGISIIAVVLALVALVGSVSLFRKQNVDKKKKVILIFASLSFIASIIVLIIAINISEIVPFICTIVSIFLSSVAMIVINIQNGEKEDTAKEQRSPSIFKKISEILDIHFPFPVSTFVTILIICFTLAVSLLIIVNPSSNKDVDKVIEQFQYDGYSIPTYVAYRYNQYLRMMDFYSFLHYFFIIASAAMSIITISYAAISVKKSDKEKKENKKRQENAKSALIAYAMFSLLFSMFEYMIDPLTIAHSAQYSKVQLEKSIISVVYDTELSDSEKSRIIAEDANRVAEELDKKIHFYH